MERTKTLEPRSQQEQLQSVDSVGKKVKSSLSSILTSLKEKGGDCLGCLKGVVQSIGKKIVDSIQVSGEDMIHAEHFVDEVTAHYGL